MKKVLLIGYPFPLRQVGSPRVLGLAKYLPEFGWQPLVVTDRGTPVAKLVPIPRDQDPEMQRLRRLEAQGLITFPTGKLPADFWDLPRPKDPDGLVLKALLEERESGW